MIIAKILVFTINFVLWASGILLIVFGSIALASPSTIVNLLDLINGVSNITPLINVGSILEGMSIFMIVLGSLLFLFGGVGCHGFHRMHKRLIMNYWIMLILGILTEIGVIIYGGVYPNTAVGSIKTQMYGHFPEFQPVNITDDGSISYSTSQIPEAWEKLQAQTQCCGVVAPSDYSLYFSPDNFTITNYPDPMYVPPSCCAINPQLISAGNLPPTIKDYQNFLGCIYNNATTSSNLPYYYTKGCYNIAMEMLWNFNYIAMIIAGCLIAVQILGAILTIHTWHRMFREDGRI